MLFQDEIVKKSRKKVFRNVFYKQVDYRKVIQKGREGEPRGIFMMGL